MFFRSLCLFSMLGIFTGLFLSQVVADSKREPPKKTRRYVNLIVGLDENVKMPYMPKKPQFKGNFKSITTVLYSKELKTLRFSPKKVGSATLTIQDRRGRIISEFFLTVRKSDLNKVAKEIQLLLNDIDGIKVRIINNKVIVDGQVLLPKELSRIHDVVSQYGGQASNIVTLSLIAQKKIAEFIERDINNPQIHVRSVNGKFLIEGVASNKTEKQRAEIIAKTYVPDIPIDRGAGKGGVIQKVKVAYVINLLTIAEKPKPQPQPEKIIQLVVHFVELNKDYQKGFRFDWTPEMRDGSSLEFQSSLNRPSGIVGSITGTIYNLLPKLNWAKEHGYARVLQSASVIVKNGVAGTIKSTTQVPYQVVGQGGVPGTEFKDAGITSTITPTMVGPRSDSINLAINFEVSNLVGRAGNAPLIASNVIQTEVVVRSRQSAAIGGLVQQNSTTGFNKLPRNAANPLFSLYASRDFQRKQSQFVVFITPVIKSSASAGSERIKSKFRLRN